jgi:hypothetical protein
MALEPFDYGTDSAASHTDPLNDLDEMLGGSGSARPRPPSRESAFADLGMRVILQVAVAVLLLAAAVGLFVYDTRARQKRDAAFQQVLSANDQREYLRVIEGAEQFLSNSSLNGADDGREESIVGLYKEALVHWVAQRPGGLDADALARVERFKRLAKSRGK